MSSSPQPSTLTRLLTLNTRIHDLENQLHKVALPERGTWRAPQLDLVVPNLVAELQEEIDRETRASLVTCWLGMPDEIEE